MTEDLRSTFLERFSPDHTRILWEGEKAVEHSLFCHQKIERVASQNNLSLLTYSADGHTLLLIDDTHGIGIPQALATEWIEEGVKAEQLGTYDNCDYIAAKHVVEGKATGTVYARGGIWDFVGYSGGHTLSYQELSDGSFLAIDWTADDNIDCRQGNFQVLAIKAPSLDILRLRLNMVYGGEWYIRPPKYVQDAYNERIYNARVTEKLRAYPGTVTLEVLTGVHILLSIEDLEKYLEANEQTGDPHDIARKKQLLADSMKGLQYLEQTHGFLH